ncbi:MAG: hypothetical protein GF329_05425 [Candidatus Lokiarchaeota archaeon]|nr:hypothetical protein [Candidatus Lokiarchaeota archaeon]
MIKIKQIFNKIIIICLIGTMILPIQFMDFFSSDVYIEKPQSKINDDPTKIISNINLETYNATGPYKENIEVLVDRYGNLSINGVFNGSFMDFGLSTSMSEYNGKYNIYLSVLKEKKSRNIFDYYDIPQVDFYLAISTMSVLDSEIVLDHCESITDDYEIAFNLPELEYLGKLPLKHKGSFPYEHVSMEADMMTYIFGNNFTGLIDFDHFYNLFQTDVPSGLNDLFTSEVINNSNNARLDWILHNYLGAKIQKLASVQLEFPHEYNLGVKNNYSLNLNDIFGVSKINSTYQELTHEIYSTIKLNLANCEIQNYSNQGDEFTKVRNQSQLEYILLDYQPYWRGYKQLDEIVVNFTNPISDLELLSPKNIINQSSKVRARFTNPEIVDFLNLLIWDPDHYEINQNSGIFSDYLPPLTGFELTNMIDISNMDNNSQSVYDFDAVIDSNNNLHVVYTKTMPLSLDREVFYKEYNGTDWITYRITNDSREQRNVSITVDSADNVHIVFDEGLLNTEIMYTNNTDGIFGTPISISENPTNQDAHPIIVNNNLVNYVIWTNLSNINYRSITSGSTLGPIQNITNDNSEYGALDVAINDAGTVLHIIALNFSYNSLNYFNHTINGSISSQIFEIYSSDTAEHLKYSDLEIDTDNTLYITYSAQNDVQYFNISSNGIWSNTVNITDDGNKSEDLASSIALDSSKNVYISYIISSDLEHNINMFVNLTSMEKKEIYSHNCGELNYCKILINGNDEGYLISQILVNDPVSHIGLVYQMINDTWFTKDLNSKFFYNLPNGDYIFELILEKNGYSQSITKKITISNDVDLSAEILSPEYGYKTNDFFESINITINVTSGPENISYIAVFPYTWHQKSYLTGERRFVCNWSSTNTTNHKAPISYYFNWSTDALFKTGNYTICVVINDINNVSLILEREIYIKANGIGINNPNDGDTLSNKYTIESTPYLASGCSLFGAGGGISGQFYVSVLRSDNLDPIIPDTYQEVYVIDVAFLPPDTYTGEIITSDLDNGEYILLPSFRVTDGINYLNIDFWENITIINISNSNPLTINSGSVWSNVNNIFKLNFTLTGSSNLGAEYTSGMGYFIHKKEKNLPILHQLSTSILYTGGNPYVSGFYTAEHEGEIIWNESKSIWELSGASLFSGNDSGWATYNMENKQYLLTIFRITNNTNWGSLGAFGNFEYISPNKYLQVNNSEKFQCTILNPSLNETIENTIFLNASFNSPYGHKIDSENVRVNIYIHNGSQIGKTILRNDYLAYNPITECYDGFISLGNISSKYLYVEIRGNINETDFTDVSIKNNTFLRIKYSDDSTPPAVPLSFNATAQTDGSILLEWTNSTSVDVNSYIILRNSTEIDPYILDIVSASQLSYVDSLVSEGVNYTYWLYPMDNNSLYNGPITTSEIADSTPPSINLLSPENMKFYNHRLPINASVIEDYHDIDMVYCMIFNASWNSSDLILRRSGSFFINDTLLTSSYNDGLYGLTVYVNDSIGNTNNVSISLYFDNSIPTIEQIYSPLENAAYYPNITINTLITDLSGVNTSWAYIANQTDYNATIVLNRIGSSDIWSGIWLNTSGQFYENGKYNITILANDSLSNGITQTENRSFFINSDIPKIEEPIHSPEIGENYKDLVLINASISDSDGISKAWCEIKNSSGHVENITLLNNEGYFYNNSWNTSRKEITDGNYSLIIYANDTLTNLAQSSTYLIYIDNTPPASVEVSRVIDNWTDPHDSSLGDTEFRDTLTILADYYESNIKTVEFFNGSDLLGINKSADQLIASWAWNTTISGIAQLSIRVNDTAGNSVSSPIQSFTINIDNSNPVGVKINNIIDSEGHNYTNGDQYYKGTLYFMCEFLSETYPKEAILYDSNWNILNITKSFIGNTFNLSWDTGSYNGDKQFYVELNDTTDHTNVTSLYPNETITIDNKYPQITMIEIWDSNGHLYSDGDRNFNGLLTLRVSWIELNPSHINFSIGSTLIQSLSNPTGGFSQITDWDTTAINDGSYQLQVVLSDLVNQKYFISRNIIIDNNAPIIISTTAEILTGNQITVSGYSDDNGGSGVVSAEIIGGNASSYFTSSVIPTSGLWSFTNISPIIDATYILSIKNKDNISYHSIISIKFQVDNTIPNPPTNLNYQKSENVINITWDSTDQDIEFFKIYRNGTLISIVNSTTDFYLDGPLAPGNYGYTIRSVDQAGHESSESLSININIESTEITPGTQGFLDILSLIIGLLIGIVVMIPIAFLLRKKKKPEEKPSKKPSKGKSFKSEPKKDRSIPIKSETEKLKPVPEEIKPAKPIPMPKKYICTKCGTEILSDGKVCPNCGSKSFKEKTL